MNVMMAPPMPVNISPLAARPTLTGTRAGDGTVVDVQITTTKHHDFDDEAPDRDEHTL